MSLDKIQLPFALIPELYKETLVLLDSQQPKSEKTTTRPFNFLGSYKNRILILVEEPDAVYLHDNELNLLTNLLNVCQSGLQQVAIVNLHHLDTHFTAAELIRETAPEKMIVFHDQPTTISSTLKYFEITAWAGLKTLTAPSLNTLNTQRELKKKLWPQPLQDFFEIKTI